MALHTTTFYSVEIDTFALYNQCAFLPQGR